MKREQKESNTRLREDVRKKEGKKKSGSRKRFNGRVALFFDPWWDYPIYYSCYHGKTKGMQKEILKIACWKLLMQTNCMFPCFFGRKSSCSPIDNLFLDNSNSVQVFLERHCIGWWDPKRVNLLVLQWNLKKRLANCS